MEVTKIKLELEYKYYCVLISLKKQIACDMDDDKYTTIPCPLHIQIAL